MSDRPGTPPEAGQEQQSVAARPRRRGGTFRNNVVWQIVGSGSQAVLSGLVLLVSARALGAHDFGVFSIVMGVTYVANALFEPRMQDVAARHFWGLHDHERDGADQAADFVDILILEIVVKLMPCLAVAGLSPWIAKAAHLPPIGAELIVWAAFGTYLSKLGYGLSTGLLRVIGRSDLFVICVSAELAVRLLLMGALAAFGQLSVLNAIVIQSFTGLISISLQWFWARRQLPAMIRWARWTPASALARLAPNRRLIWSNFGLSMADLMSKDLDITLMSLLTSPTNIGVYKMAKNIALLTWRAVDPFTLSLMPEVNRMVSVKAFGELRRLQARSSLGLFAMTLFMAVGICVGVWLLGRPVLGPGYDAVPALMPVVMSGLLVGAPLVWAHPLSVALDRPDIAVLGSVAGTIAGVSALWFLTPVLGIFGAGIGWSLTFMTQFVYTAVFANRRLGRVISTERVSAGEPVQTLSHRSQAL